jgi:hypothetical protein
VDSVLRALSISARGRAKHGDAQCGLEPARHRLAPLFGGATLSISSLGIASSFRIILSNEGWPGLSSSFRKFARSPLLPE